jgi:hypothetical protein
MTQVQWLLNAGNPSVQPCHNQSRISFSHFDCQPVVARHQSRRAVSFSVLPISAAAMVTRNRKPPWTAHEFTERHLCSVILHSLLRASRSEGNCARYMTASTRDDSLHPTLAVKATASSEVDNLLHHNTDSESRPRIQGRRRFRSNPENPHDLFRRALEQF